MLFKIFKNKIRNTIVKIIWRPHSVFLKTGIALF